MGWIIPTIKGILVAIGATATLGAAGTGALAAAIGAAVVVGGAMVAKRVMSLFEIEMPTVDTDASRQRTVKSTTEPQKIIYGEALVSGPISFIGLSGTDNSDLYQTIVLAGHEVTDITDIHMDDVVITDSQINGGSTAGGNVTAGTFGPKDSNTICTINKYLGLASQTADPLFVSAFGNYTSAHRGDGIAYLAMKWVLNEDSAETWDKFTPQNVKALVKGKPVYDPRLDTGAPNYNPLNQLFITYNATAGSYVGQGQNPALVLADYLISDLGMGISPSKIDWSSFITAANGCDVSVSVPGGTEKRFTCNGVVFATDSHQKNINKILSSMNGNLVYSNGKYIVHAGIYEAPTETLTEDDLIGAISIKTSLERSDRFNTIKGLFIDPSQNHKSTEFPKVQLADAVARDNNEILEKEVQYPMTNSSYMAQRLSNKLIQLSDQQKVVTFPANLSALRITAGDRVQVSVEELNWSNKVFQCAGWTFSEDGGVNLTLREDSSTSYADPAVNEYSTVTATGDITDAFRGVPSPSGLTATAGLKSNELNWVNPAKPNDFGTIYVYASPNGNFSSAVKIGETDGTQFIHDASNSADSVVSGDVRYYWVRAVRNIGTDAASQSNLEPNADPNTTVFATVGRVNWADVAGSTGAPEDNATVGATLSENLYDIDEVTVLGVPDVKNQVVINIETEDNIILQTEVGNNLFTQAVGDVGLTVFTEVNALGAQYSIKINNNGRIAGFGLSSTLPTDTTDPAFSEFVVIADKFAIVDPLSTELAPIQPFTVTSQKIVMGTDVEINGNLLTTGTTISDVALQVGSGSSFFKASSDGLQLGNETFVSAPFRVTPAGAVTATSVDITGTVDASDGFTFDGLTVSGTLAAGNIDVSGVITSGSLITDSATIANDIRIGSGEAVFSADSNGIYLGNETFADAEFSVTPAGVLTATGADITGAITATSLDVSSATVTGTITASNISGDISELYPVKQIINTSVTYNDVVQTFTPFSLPAPELSISKRQVINVIVNLTASNTNTSNATTTIFISLDRKSKTNTGIEIGTVTSESFPSMFQQIVSLAGNRLGDLDSTGNVSDSATPTTNIGTMNALYYDQTANKTYIQVGYPGILFATNETLYWSPSNFASSGTWVQMTGSTTEQIYVPPQSTINRRIPINLTLGPSTTATDLRLKVQGSQTAQSGISALIKDFAGTISNIS